MKTKPSASDTPSTSLFSTSLSSLLASSAASKPKPPSLTRPTPSSNTKDNIFTTHNRHTRKRALADISSSSTSLPQHHATHSEEVSTATLSRSRRKMEEKARLYASMKRGDYVPDGKSGINREAEGLVDFDRKWAEDADTKNPLDGGASSSEDDYASDEPTNADMSEMVEYEDEMGRTRLGTRAQAEKLRKQTAAAAYFTTELDMASAHPSTRPSNLIIGDTVQHLAFNPDNVREQAMAELAKKRDRSMTPPEEVHYDASKEVRSKGVGFYQFSRGKEGRERELGELGAERRETERVRGEREGVVEKKRRVVEERRALVEEERRKVVEERGRREADRFLEGLDVGGGGEMVAGDVVGG